MTPADVKALMKALKDMQRASEQIDNAADGTAYQLGLVSLALMARKFLRDHGHALLQAHAREGEPQKEDDCNNRIRKN